MLIELKATATTWAQAPVQCVLDVVDKESKDSYSYTPAKNVRIYSISDHLKPVTTCVRWLLKDAAIPHTRRYFP